MITEITCRCPFCNSIYSVKVDSEEYMKGMAAWKSGALIQDAFPNFSPEVRESLKTGICVDCWENL